MNTSSMSRRLLLALALMLASLSALAPAQVPSMITACVNAKGTIRIIATGQECTAKEHRITWPAEPTGGVSYYQRSATAKLLNVPMTVVVPCGHRQGFWSKTHGSVVQEGWRALHPLLGYGHESCPIHTPPITDIMGTGVFTKPFAPCLV